MAHLLSKPEFIKSEVNDHILCTARIGYWSSIVDLLYDDLPGSVEALLKARANGAMQAMSSGKGFLLRSLVRIADTPASSMKKRVTFGQTVKIIQSDFLSPILLHDLWW
jgi:hypothetical protein